LQEIKPCAKVFLSARKQPTDQNKMKTLSQIKEIIAANREAGNYLFENLTSAECGQWSGWIMFGDDEEAFPSQAEWAMITD
jgi:hypothetical protein